MATNIELGTVLDLYEIIRTILKSNTTISEKFNNSDFYEIEPNFRNLTFKQLPYIVIRTPSLDPQKIVMDNSLNLEEISVSIILVIDYDARDKNRTYLNAIITSLNGSQSSFEEKGYYDPLLSVDEPNPPELINGRQVISTEMTLTVQGAISR